MKPCKSCPFSLKALPGLWSAEHYIVIAYLGSANIADLAHVSMGCHQWNGVCHPGLSPDDAPKCGGWLRAARHTSIAIRLGVILGRIDPRELLDGEAVLDPVAMLRQQGVDVDRLPPLEWKRPTARYPTQGAWERDFMRLYRAMRADPRIAEDYVLPGSPLARGVTYDQVAAHLGRDIADRYFTRDEDEDEDDNDED